MSDKKTKTRERILEAARDALIEQGPVDPSVGQVMAAAGLTVGGFYAHFDSKEELMLEAFRQLLAERRARLSAIDSSLDGEERRALVAAFYLSRKHRDRDIQEHACPIPNALNEIQRLPEVFRQVLAEHIELMTAQMVDRPEDIDKAFADLALMIGGLALARALGNCELSDRILRAAKSAVI
ncbi:TetR/AcrR family transcriptional regulator [Pseudomonas sp. NPDC089554]|uniref:TetR/AcrR family transcriptional regulator n=1 Tax=Pseudomonas sp. NPDC089554 TaxID=3390653 RepID=UPI003D07503D